MTDPNDITQASAVVESAGGPGGIVGAALGALTVLGGLWRIVFGTKAERVAADAQEDDALKHAADIALRQAERAERDAARAEADTKSVRVERDDCTARLALHEERSALERAEDRARIAALEAGLAEHATCGPRIAFLTAENEWMGRGLLAVAAGEPLPERPDTLTPPANPSPNEVRAALAAREETGP